MVEQINRTNKKNRQIHEAQQIMKITKRKSTSNNIMVKHNPKDKQKILKTAQKKDTEVSYSTSSCLLQLEAQSSGITYSKGGEKVIINIEACTLQSLLSRI